MKKLIFIVFSLILLFGQTLFGNTIIIPDDYPTIQEGIDASVNGDTVLVDTGRYFENINYNGKNIVVGSLFLTTQDTSYISQTIIDGNQNGSVVTFENGEDSFSVLCGFTITNGSAYQAGGIYCSNNSNPSIFNIIVNNNVAFRGGGISCVSNSNPSINEVIISENLVTQFFACGGGGLYCYNSSPILDNVTIKGNTADLNCAGGGGGVYCEYNSSPILYNSIIINNIASGGGGILCENDSNPVLDNVIIINNLANSYGGGIYLDESNPSFTHLLLANNTALSRGGGICCLYHSSPNFISSTISGNLAYDNGGGIFCWHDSHPSLANSIIWSDYPEEIYFYSAYSPNSITIAYCDIFGGEDFIATNNNGTVYWLDGNIFLEPLFVDPGNGDFHLQEDSPCIDAGIAFFVWEGDTLVNIPDSAYYGTAPDMGAYEWQGYAVDGWEKPINKTVLYQNYPNPFSPKTIISYSLCKASNVKIMIYNIKGQLVKTLVDAQKPAGYHTIECNAKNMSSGIYFYKFEANDKVFIKKMIILR